MKLQTAFSSSADQLEQVRQRDGHFHQQRRHRPKVHPRHWRRPGRSQRPHSGAAAHDVLHRLPRFLHGWCSLLRQTGLELVFSGFRTGQHRSLWTKTLAQFLLPFNLMKEILPLYNLLEKAWKNNAMLLRWGLLAKNWGHKTWLGNLRSWVLARSQHELTQHEEEWRSK